MNQKRMNPILSTVATISYWESKLDELERINPERYAEFMTHFQIAMEILKSEGVITPEWAAVFDVSSADKSESTEYSPRAITDEARLDLMLRPDLVVAACATRFLTVRRLVAILVLVIVAVVTATILTC